MTRPASVAFAFGVAALAVALGVVATNAKAAGGNVFWEERFDHGPLDWADPLNHSPAELARVYTLAREGDQPFLHARHDRTSGNVPAMHYGKPFQTNAAPLDKVKALTWKWRVLQHPNVTDDPWEDVAAGVYVVIRQPNLVHGGRGFKFGWLAKPGSPGHQRGLLEMPLRADPATHEWKTESVDLCALYKHEYGGECEGEKVLYVGVVTDADGTKSVSEADYADFSLELNP